jgi:hypothetical protein
MDTKHRNTILARVIYCVVIIALAFSATGSAIAKGEPHPLNLSIRAYIDGYSQLVIQGNNVHWHHIGAAAPGRLDFVNEPTYLNRTAWYPTWPDIPDAENRDCNCDSTTFSGLRSALPKNQGFVLNVIQARNSVYISQQPSADNDYTLVVDFDDGPPAGAEWYEVELVPMPGWQQMNVSGFGDSNTVGVSALEIFRGQLYAGASNWVTGGQVWRLQQAAKWQPVSVPGFGSTTNTAILDLAVFQGQLYAGTGWNGYTVFGKVWRSADGTKWQLVTDDGFSDTGNYAVTNFIVFKDMLYAGTSNNVSSAQIWRSSTGKSNTWKKVAPDEPGFPGGVDGFAVYKEVLYAAIELTQSGTSVQVWRSSNGSDWTAAIADGFGDPGNISVSGFAQFGGYLYLGTRNDATGAQLWRTRDGIHWKQVVGNGFSDLNNVKIESLLVYDGDLYAATNNPSMGMQVWRSTNGMRWEQIASNGFGDNGNYATLWNSATIVYRGKLLVGTWNNNGGELWMFTP